MVSSFSIELFLTSLIWAGVNVFYSGFRSIIFNIKLCSILNIVLTDSYSLWNFGRSSTKFICNAGDGGFLYKIRFRTCNDLSGNFKHQSSDHGHLFFIYSKWIITLTGYRTDQTAISWLDIVFPTTRKIKIGGMLNHKKLVSKFFCKIMIKALISDNGKLKCWMSLLQYIFG